MVVNLLFKDELYNYRNFVLINILSFLSKYDTCDTEWS